MLFADLTHGAFKAVTLQPSVDLNKLYTCIADEHCNSVNPATALGARAACPQWFDGSISDTSLYELAMPATALNPKQSWCFKLSKVSIARYAHCVPC